MKMTILYEIGNKLYLNITNKCPCDCTFCIRNNAEGAYGSDSLWLEQDPTAEQTIAELRKKHLNDYSEIIFCGYGEPTEALDVLIAVAEYIKSVTKTPVRLNTNGLSDLINGKLTAHFFEGLIDVVSVSLNAGSESEYLRVTQPSFGRQSFAAMQKFAVDCKSFVPKVMFSIVDVISAEEVELCREISEKTGVALRIRKLDS